MRSFEEFQGRVFRFGNVVEDTVTVTVLQVP